MFMIPPIGRVIRRAALLTQILATALVFVVLFAFAIISWQSAEHTLEVQNQQVIDEKADSISDSIQRRMQTNGVLLRAGAGLYYGSADIDRNEWQSFFAQFDVQSRFDGVSAVGFAPVVTRDEVPEFEQALKDDDLPKTTILPATDKDEYVPVLYSENYRGDTPNFGFDMASEPQRQAALKRARDSGTIAMTDMLRLTIKDRRGLILFMPVYDKGSPVETVAERRAALRGYVYVGLRVNELFDNVLSKDDTAINFTVNQIRNDGKKTQMFTTRQSASTQESNPASERSADFSLYGQQWNIDLRADDAIVSVTDRQRPSIILAGGTVLALVVSMVVYLLIQYRTRTFALAEEHRLQQAKDELLSLASHQLRTPATGVKQYIGMVIEGFGGKVPKAQQALLEQAYKSNERQLQIINEFLYVAKIGSGSLTTTVHKFDLVPVVRDVLDEMEGEIKDKKHTLNVKMPKTVNVMADEHSVRMIIENLISNAVKYTHPKGTISVTVQRGLQEVRVAVEDTGVGIAKKDESLLFKQFSRIPNELSGEVNGSGIGLYLSQQLALRNKGSITLESVPEVGSVFTLHLPTKSVRKFTKNSSQQ